MKTIFLAHAYASTPKQFHVRMMNLLGKVSSLSRGVSVRGCIQYPEVPQSDVVWYETYRSEIYNSDLVILVCDHDSNILRGVAKARTFNDYALWCFMPRSILAPIKVVELVNEHRVRFQEKSVQAVYPYDSDEDIIRMVAQWVGLKRFTPIAQGTMIEVTVRRKLINLILTHRIFQAASQ